jgi:ferredoxin
MLELWSREMSDENENIVDFYDNAAWYTPSCCRPGGRCTIEHVDTSEDEELLAAIREHFRWTAKP